MSCHLIHIDSHGLKAGFTSTAIPLISQLVCVKSIATIDTGAMFQQQMGQEIDSIFSDTLHQGGTGAMSSEAKKPVEAHFFARR